MLQVPYLFSHETTSNPVISDLCLEVDEICTLLGYYAASSGNFLPTFQDNLSVNR